MESLNYWIGELSAKAPGTREKYRDYFERFCNFAQKTPDELITQRRQDLKSDDPREKRAVEYRLRDFVTDLKEHGMSTSTQQIAFAAVKSFFESNEYPLVTKRSEYPRGESMGSRAITKPIIKQILEDAKRTKDKKKVRALIMFLKDTGLRISDVRSLNYGHINAGLEKNLEFIPLQLVTQKSHTIAKTFLGPEAIAAYREYLEERQKGTRRIPAEQVTKESPLFRTNFNGEVQRISRSGLSGLIRFHCTTTGTTKLSAHSFRKFVQTTLDAAGISPNFVDQIIGHKLINSRDAYSLPSDEQLLDAYKAAYPQLRIYPTKSEVEERVTDLEGKINEKNEVIAALAAKTAELEKIKEEREIDQRNLMYVIMQLERLEKMYNVVVDAYPNLFTKPETLTGTKAMKIEREIQNDVEQRLKKFRRERATKDKKA